MVGGGEALVAVVSRAIGTALRVPGCRGLQRAFVVCVLVSWVWVSAPALVLAATPVVDEESVADVSASSATLRAKVNAEKLATTYSFEYDTSEYDSSASHGEKVPSPEGEVGEGTEDGVVEAHPQALRPDTVYHFRVVLKSTGGTERGADETFTTGRAGGGLNYDTLLTYSLRSQN